MDVTFEHADDARFDLVVGADGVHSATRRLAFGPGEQFATYLGGYAAFFTLAHYDVEPGWFAMACPVRRSGSAPTSTPRLRTPCSRSGSDRDPALRGDRAGHRRRGPAVRGRGLARPAPTPCDVRRVDLYFDGALRAHRCPTVAGRVALGTRRRAARP